MNNVHISPTGLALPTLTPEIALVLLCVLVIGYSLGYLVSHAIRRIGRYLDHREAVRKKELDKSE